MDQQETAGKLPNDKRFSGGPYARRKSTFRFGHTGASGAGNCGLYIARPLQARVRLNCPLPADAGRSECHGRARLARQLSNSCRAERPPRRAGPLPSWRNVSGARLRAPPRARASDLPHLLPWCESRRCGRYLPQSVARCWSCRLQWNGPVQHANSIRSWSSPHPAGGWIDVGRCAWTPGPVVPIPEIARSHGPAKPATGASRVWAARVRWNWNGWLETGSLGPLGVSVFEVQPNDRQISCGAAAAAWAMYPAEAAAPTAAFAC